MTKTQAQSHPQYQTDTSSAAVGGLLLGRITSLQENGNPMVVFDEASMQAPVEALTTVALDESSIGKDVAVSFTQNQGGVAIVMGVIRRLIDDVIADSSGATLEQSVEESQTKNLSPEVLVNGNKLELSAAEEITLRCGEASITLNKHGKILLKGEHMLNRVSGAFKVKSGTVELN